MKIIKPDKKTELFKLGIIPFSSTGCKFSILAFGKARIIAARNKAEAKYMNNSEARAIASSPYNKAIINAATNNEFIIYAGVSGIACIVIKLPIYHGIISCLAIL